jgi:hypothetical protein
MPKKCPIHRTWARNGVCEPCKLVLDKIQKQNEMLAGSNKPKVRTTKL